MGEESLRIYIRGKRPMWRKKNIQALALEHFPQPSGKKGNVTAMFHAALNEKWNLDPETSLPKEPLLQKVAEKLNRPHPYDSTPLKPKK